MNECKHKGCKNMPANNSIYCEHHRDAIPGKVIPPVVGGALVGNMLVPGPVGAIFGAIFGAAVGAKMVKDGDKKDGSNSE